MRTWLLACALTLLVSSIAAAADSPFIRQEDVVYGRKHGMALTLDVINAKDVPPNGAAVIWVISGGWHSSHEGIRPEFVQEVLKRGYTIFAVVHGSQPRFTIPEAMADMQRAVRFIRANAERFKIDPNRIGVMGASAGGHLSLILGTTGDDGNPKAADPIDRASSRVQAVACFFPPTDFFNYGKTGEVALGTGVLKDFKPPFDFNEPDPKTKRYERITDEQRREAIGKHISPVTHVTKDDAPMLIIHGDADKLVPIQQAQIFIEKCEAAGVPCKLATKPGAAHGWANMHEDLITISDWFDKHLAKQ